MAEQPDLFPVHLLLVSASASAAKTTERAAAIDDARDISSFGGWRAFLASEKA